MMYGGTGATGQLGTLIINTLLETIAAEQIVAAVRTSGKAASLAAKGVLVREADYDRPQTLAAAFKGVDQLIFISSNEVGRRTPQHQAVIDAARQAEVGQIIYTSLLHADTSPLGLAPEHRETEAALSASGVPHVLLRNGWYTENHLAGLAAVLQHDTLLGCAKEGRIASASRADYAAAAVAVATGDGQAEKVYELAGDNAWSLPDLAAEIGRQTGRTINYMDMPEDNYAGILQGAGLPPPLARLFANCDAGAAGGALFDDSHTLRRLIGRPTTPIATTVRTALAALD